MQTGWFGSKGMQVPLREQATCGKWPVETNRVQWNLRIADTVFPLSFIRRFIWPNCPLFGGSTL